MIFQGFNLMMESQRYGLGDLSRAIQSVSGYLGCRYVLSVGQFILLLFVMKVIV